MKCPKCKKVIEKVYVISEYTQSGLLKGNKVDNYESITFDSPIGTTLRIECSECNENITKFVKEN